MKRLLWLVLIVAAATAIAVVAIPTLYIQPFKPQRADWLARAYALRRAGPTVTAIALPVVVFCAIGLVWAGTLSPESVSPGAVSPGSDPHTDRGGLTPRGLTSRDRRRRYLRLGLATGRGLTLLILIGFTGLVTWFSRQNHFEWMFAPPAAVTYVPAKEASTFLTGDEMVMAIDVGGLSLAYPIRQMAYHHVVNDIIGTTPVVVTY